MTSDPQEKDQLSKLLKWGMIIGGVLFILFWIFKPTMPESEPSCSSSDAKYIAEKWIKKQLKNPDGAEFSGLKETTTTTTSGGYTVRGWVESTNSFNATIRSNYAVVMTCEKGSYTAVSIDL